MTNGSVRAAGEMAEIRATHSALAIVGEVGNLAHAIDQMYLLRNRTQGMAPEIAEARRNLIDLILKLLRNQLKKDISQRLIPALQEWEKYE